MISKSQVKLISSLRIKKFRKEEGLFIAEGEKVVNDLLQSGWQIRSVFGTREYFEGAGKGIFSGIRDKEIITDNELKKISTLTTPQSVLAIAEIPSMKIEGNYKSGLFLALDGISDPGNLGTIIRIADWFGISEIICSENSADCFNPKVVQSAMGSLFRVGISYGDLTDFFSRNKMKAGLPVYGTVLNGKNIFREKLTSDAIILIGSESKGISDRNLEFISCPVTIPSYKNTAADSLNAAVATGIVCAEFRRG